jgi:hypothetical protein
MSIAKKRVGVFETNSSSCHSLAIRDNMDTLEDARTDNYVNSIAELVEELTPQCNLEFNNEEELEFGWGPEVKSSVKDKIAYAIASKYDIGEIEEIIRRYIPNFNEFVLPLIKNMHFKPWWYDEKTMDTNMTYHGHIDHDSEGTLQGALYRHNISLEEYIFNSNLAMIIDNDNRDFEEPEEEFKGWNQV